MKKKLLVGCTLALVAAVVVAAIGYLSLKRYVVRKADQKLASAVKRLGKDASIRHGPVDVSLFRRSLDVDRIELRWNDGRSVAIKGVNVRKIDTAHGKPRFLDVDLNGIVLDVTEKNLGSLARDLADLGYAEIHADARIEYEYDEGSGALAVKELWVRARDMGELKLKGSVRNLDFGKIRANDVTGLAVDSFEVDYRDGDLLKKIVLRARGDDLPFYDFVLEGLHEDIITAKAGEAGQAGEAATDGSWAHALEALAGFIEEPNRLSVRVELKQPVQMEAVLAEKKTSRLLDLVEIVIKD